MWPDLIFSEEAGNDSPGGGPGEADLAVDDDGSVELGACQSSGEKVEVSVTGRAGVTDGNAVEGETCNQFCRQLRIIQH